MPKQGVGQHQHLAHDRREGHLRRLASFTEFTVLANEVRVVADRADRRHVEQAPRPGPAAVDKAPPLPGSRLARHRRQARQAGCRLAVDHAQFRHLREQACGGDRPDSGHGGQHLGLARQHVVARDQLRDLGVQRRDLPVYLGQPVPQLPLQQLVTCVLLAVQSGGAVLHQRVPRRLQFVQIAPRRRRQVHPPKVECRAHHGQHTSIHRVRLGVLAQGLRETPRPLGVHARKRQRLRQRLLEGPVPGARGLVCQTVRLGPDPGGQRLESGSVVGKL